MKYLWEDILSNHPSTKKVFLKDKYFDIQHNTTYKKLIDKINTIDLNNDHDVLGNAYEEVIQDVMVGKVLGQFFTPPSVKNMMVKLIDPQIHEDGKIDTCGDPAMGTGGFLITYLQYLLHQANVKNITPNWNFIKTEGLHGKEIEPDTYQLAVSNMLITSGHMFESLDRGDSIRNPITRKFDNILANPPFGIKGLDYDDIQSLIRDEYVPIRTNSAVPLFIQAIICMLNINGKCAVVLPAGQELFSRNATLVAIREYLMKTCDLKEILYLPAGIFTYTTIKPCVFYFIKKREGTSVLKSIIKVSKSQNETDREYVFSKTYQTTKVKFYDYNPYEDVKTLLIEVPIEQIANNSYSLNYAEYVEDKTEEHYGNGVNVRTLGELFNIEKGTLQSSKNKEGEYTFITASDTNKTHNNFTYDCECVMLVGGAEGSLAKAQYFNGKFIASDLLYVLTLKNKYEMINYKYVWYYLNFNRNKHLLDDTICCGTPKKMISKDRCSKIKIPIPSLDKQQEIVKYLDFIYEKANKTSYEKIAELKQLNEFCLNNQKIFGENVVKELGEISTINPENIKSGHYAEINYIDITSVKGGQILELQKLTDNFPSRAKRIVKKGDILYSSVRPNLKGYVYISDDIQNGIASTGFANIRVKNPNITLSKYLYYVMTSDYICNNLTSKAKGAQYPAVSFDDFETLKIHIPSLERQKEIVEYCEHNDALINQLELEIENNKKQAHIFMMDTIKSHHTNEICEQIEEQETKCPDNEIQYDDDSIQYDDNICDEEYSNNEENNALPL
jgi:type I restriction-modification system DNA methylase subunit